MKRISLAHLPTPLQKPERLAEAIGCDLWVKRDDATGGPEAGNKIRKLEFLLADALAQGADTVITCGGVQSNHSRATALMAARLGLRAKLVLRAPSLTDDDGGRGIPRNDEHAPLIGNVMLDRMAGAEIRLITPETYQRRAELMAGMADELKKAGRKAYIIPEGGSNGLGALGYVEAMAEVRRQLDAGEAGGKPFDVIVHACGSGGTAAGVALGAARYGVADELQTMAVCFDAAYFTKEVERVLEECVAIDPSLGKPVKWVVDDAPKGPAYAVATPEQRALIVEATRLSGLVFDPVYTGKALDGLWRLAKGPLKGRRVLFIHTGGLPGLLAQSTEIAPDLA